MAERPGDRAALRWAPFLGVAALLAANLQKLVDPRWIPSHDSLFHLTKFLYVYAALGQHELPLWDSYLYGGAQPFYLLLNNALALDPLLWIVGGLGSAFGVPPKDAFVIVTLAGIVLFALGGAQLARELFGDAVTPVVAFTALLFCGEASLWSQQVYDFAVIEYVPWALAFGVRYARRPSAGRFLAFLVALAICSSVYYPAYLVVFAGCAGALVLLLQRTWLARLAPWTLARHALVGAPLAGLLLLPLALEYFEIVSQYSQVGRLAGFPQAKALDIPQLTVTHGWWSGLVPGMFRVFRGGYREAIPTVGMPAVLFMLVSLRKGRPAVLGFALMGLVGLQYVGSRPVVQWSARLFPFYTIIRTFGFFSGFLTLTAVLLACLGVRETLARASPPSPGRDHGRWELACAVACAGLALVFLPPMDALVSFGAVSLIAITMIGRGRAFAALRAQRVGLWVLCFLGVGAYDAAVANTTPFANERGALFSYRRGFGFAFERPQDYTWRHPHPDGRFPYGNLLCCITNYHLAERLDAPWFYADLRLLRLVGEDTVLRRQPAYWVKHHTTFVHRDYEDLARRPGFPELMRRQVLLVRHFDVLGKDRITDFRPLLARSILALEDDAEVRQRKARLSAAGSGPGEPPLVPQRLALLYKTANTVGFEVQLGEPGFFVYTDMYHPGFLARVDGREVPLLKAMGAFKAVELEAGTHRVEFRFAPAFRWALLAYLVVSAPLALAASALAVRTLMAGPASWEETSAIGG